MKKYIIAICAVAVGIIFCTAFLFAGTKPKVPQHVDYTVYVYPDGMTNIEVSNINRVIQTHENLRAGDMQLKAGTIILPGNGNKVFYEYPKKDKVLNGGNKNELEIENKE